MHRFARLTVLVPSVALVLAFAPAASASVTLGQLTPSASALTDCSTTNVELLEPTVTSGNGFVAPSEGTITSWSTVGSATGGGQMKIKVWRKVSDPATFQVITQSSFQTIPANTVKTFPVTLGGIQAGDVVGLTFTGHTGCLFSAPGETFMSVPGDFANGDGAVFFVPPTPTNSRIDLAATFDPSHKFTLGALSKDKKHGTATQALSVPGPGQVTATGNGVKSPGATAIAKGDVGVLIKAQGKKKRTLRETGKATLNVTFSYTPTGGSPGTAAAKVKLKKKI